MFADEAPNDEEGDSLGVNECTSKKWSNDEE